VARARCWFPLIFPVPSQTLAFLNEMPISLARSNHRSTRIRKSAQLFFPLRSLSDDNSVASFYGLVVEIRFLRLCVRLDGLLHFLHWSLFCFLFKERFGRDRVLFFSDRPLKSFFFLPFSFQLRAFADLFSFPFWFCQSIEAFLFLLYSHRISAN